MTDKDRNLKMKISAGIVALIASNGKPIPKGAITFTGDLQQMSTAASIAEELGINFDFGGGYSFVYNETDYQRVVSEIVRRKANGYHNYQ